jgi:predicted lipoprotein with Yx(FWY)xxD motif
MQRNLVMLAGAFSLLVLAACGSSTAGTLGGAPATPTAAPQTPMPTAVATPSPPPPTATPTATAAPPATGTSTALHSVATLGAILVGPKGNTLYVFLGDTSTMSNCNGSCAQNWPPLTTAGAPRATGGVSQNLLGTIKRQNGSTQVTYHGHPLYFFVADSGPGMANGENINAFGARWEVINAAGVEVVK